jgi:hypothetical protein
MHPSNVLANLLCRLLLREDGLTMSEFMWSIAAVALIVGIAVIIGPELGADWREFVNNRGSPTGHR